MTETQETQETQVSRKVTFGEIEVDFGKKATFSIVKEGNVLNFYTFAGESYSWELPLEVKLAEGFLYEAAVAGIIAKIRSSIVGSSDVMTSVKNLTEAFSTGNFTKVKTLTLTIDEKAYGLAMSRSNPEFSNWANFDDKDVVAAIKERWNSLSVSGRNANKRNGKFILAKAELVGDTEMV